MDPKPLFRAIVEMAAFFELSQDEMIPEDVAVKQLEDLGSRLLEMDADGRQMFVNFVLSTARQEEAGSGRSDRVEFLYSLPSTFGLNT